MARRHQDERAEINAALSEQAENDALDTQEFAAYWHDVMGCDEDGRCCGLVPIDDDYEWSGPR